MVGNGQNIINRNYFREGVNDDKDAALKAEPKDVLSKIISNRDNYEAIPKRLHVSNIPFRFKENDLKMLFSWLKTTEQRMLAKPKRNLTKRRWKVE